jgi:hypothetical protein
MTATCDFVPFGHTPPCCICGAESDWQIGSYVAFKATPVFYCNAHLPESWHALFQRQEREREELRERYPEVET